jgi:homoserine kinase type II
MTKRRFSTNKERAMKVYVIQHVRDEDLPAEDVKFIGVYSSEGKAQEAVARLTPLPGFVDFPNGFYVDAYEVDVDHWTEGFIA